ncbi:MAG: cytochrome c [Pseudomonadota bacterium]
MKTLAKATLIVAAATAIASPALSDPLEDAITARRGYYQVILSNFGPIVGMAKGDVEYDAEKAATFANNLQTLSMLNNGHMWPAGSDNAAMAGKTRALPKMWEDFPGVQEKGQAWAAAVGELAGVAGDGLDALRSKVGAVGESCGACHDTYRAKSF